MNQRSTFIFSMLCFGFAFLYIPIVLVIIYSFNDSKLVTVWGGWSVRWYVELFNNENILNAYPELRDKRVGFGMTNRIIEVLEEAGRFYFVEEKDEVINKMVQEWERSVDGLLEQELNVGKFATTKWFAYAEIYDFAVSNQEEISRRKAKLTNTTMVGIQVRLVNVETGRYITGSGLGTSAKEGEGVLKNLDMSFDQSTVSFATTGAVITAVANVLRRLEKRGW